MPSAVRSRLVWGASAGVLVGCLLWSRLLGLDLSFWQDEVVTVAKFAGQGPQAIFFGEYIPNNHVLFELLAWAFTRVAGESEIAFRFWAVVPALAAVGWLAWWTTERFGVRTTFAALLLLCSSPLLLQVSREARGYGLAMLAMAGVVIYADRALDHPNGKAIWAFLAFGTLGAFTLPVFVLPFAFAGIPLVLDRSLRRRALLGGLAAAALILLWFSPMLAEIIENSSQQFGRPVPWHGFASLTFQHHLFPILRLLSPGMPDITLTFPQDSAAQVWIWSIVGIALLGAATWILLRRREGPLLAVLVAPVVGTYGVMALLGMWTADRFVSYLSIPLLAMIGIGIGGAISAVSSRRSILDAGLFVAAIWLVFSFVPVADYVSHVPLEALKDASDVANRSDVDLVVTNSVRPDGFDYYLSQDPEILSPTDLEDLFCNSPSNSYVFIHHPFMADDIETSCIREGGANAVRFHQRSRGRYIDVWFVGTPPIEPPPW